MKEKKPKSDNEDESSKPTDEGSMKKSRRKGAHPSVLIAARDLILRRNVSRRRWTSCLNYLMIWVPKCMSKDNNSIE